MHEVTWYLVLFTVLLCTLMQVSQQLSQLGAVVLKLKGLGFSEEEILTVYKDGKQLPSAAIICDTRMNLESAASLLGARTNTKTNSNSGDSLLLEGTCRGQSAHPMGTNGMLTPQQEGIGRSCVEQQKQVVGRGQPYITHQYELTPFQSM